MVFFTEPFHEVLEVGFDERARFVQIFVVEGKRDEAIFTIERGFVNASYGPGFGAVYSAADTLAAGEFEIFDFRIVVFCI